MSFSCWINSDTYLLYIIHGPIQAALLVSNYVECIGLLYIRCYLSTPKKTFEIHSDSKRETRRILLLETHTGSGEAEEELNWLFKGVDVVPPSGQLLQFLG